MARIFLAMNGKRINTLDDLKTNFNAGQMLAFYKAKRLHAWLEEQNCQEILENIQSFDDSFDDDTLLSMLMAVFELSDEQIAKVTTAIPKAEVETHATQPIAPTVPEPATPAAEAEPVISKTANASAAVTDAASPSNKSDTCSSDVSITGLQWQVCLLENRDSDGCFGTDCQTIADNELAEAKLISGTGKRYKFSNAFYFDGFFWAMVNDEWVKSKDCIHWTCDQELNQILKDRCFRIERVTTSDKHVFLLGGICEKSFIVYSPQNGWSHKELDMDGILRTAAYESYLEDIYESGDYSGILGVHRWETGLFKKEYHWDHQIHSCQNVVNAGNSDFSEMYGYSDYGYGNAKVYAYKEYLFVTPADSDKGFIYAEIDQENPEFKHVSLPKGITICNYDVVSVLKTAIFAIRRGDNIGSHAGRLIFSADGLKWNVCNIESAKVIVVLESGNRYYAIAESENSGSCILFQSESGENWEQVQEFKFSIPKDYLSIATAGNNMILLFNGSTSGKYIKINVGSGKSSAQCADHGNSGYIQAVNEISAKVKELVASELGLATSAVTDETDLTTDLHAEAWQLKRLGVKLSVTLNVEFPDGEIPTKVIDIIVYAVKNRK